MTATAIMFEFDGNACNLTIPIPKNVQNTKNCDVFVDDHNFVFIADMDIKRLKCPRQFDIKDMKNIPIAFNTEQSHYTCQLPCYPDERKPECIEKGEIDNKGVRNTENTTRDFKTLFRITDSCILTIDGALSNIESDFAYGFAGKHRGKPRFSELELSHICRITNPGYLSPISRTIQREKDETKDFSADQYKLNFVELQIPDGHENPLNFTMSFEDFQLTKDEECVLHNITTKEFTLKPDTDRIGIDCGLVSILLAICYDIRCTSNDLTCESAWTRTILSPTCSYFETFENLTSVVESFLRRCLIYPLYRNYDLGRLCVEDAVDALLKSKAWIVKQLVVTYNCFCQGDPNRKSLNKYFLRDYIRYVVKVLDSDHLHTLSRNLKNVLLDTNKKRLRLNLGEIETELLKELIEDIHLTISSASEDESSGAGASESSSEGDTESESDSGSVIEKKI